MTRVSTATLVVVGVAVWTLAVLLPAVRPGAYWTMGLLVGACFVVAGIVAWRAHPGTRVGPLMVAVGVAWIPQQWVITTEWHPLFWWSLGLCGIWAAVAGHLFLAFPTGRLGTPLARVVAGAGYVIALGVQGASVALLAVTDESMLSIARAIDSAEAYTIAVIGPMVIVLAWARWREGSVAQRRAAQPVVITSIIATVVFVVDQVIVIDWLGFAVFVTFASVPLAYLGGLMRLRMDRAGVADLVVQLRQHVPADLERALAGTLHDPSLRVGYWMEDAGRYVDADGVELPEPGPRRVATRVDRGDARLAVLHHDAALLARPLLVEAACAAAAMALENQRLAADLKAQVRRLAASRARMLQAVEVERRRIERDLHDGAQQRLLSVAMTLGLAEATGTGALVSEAKEGVLAALDDLRALSHGIHPPILSERGLPGAVRELAAVAPLPVGCEVDAPEPLPKAVESTAYFVVSEALANITKHARAGRAWIGLKQANGHLELVVGDDGRGGADPQRGSGLAGLVDRVETVSGRLRLDSPPGHGTVLRVEIPCA